MLLNSYSVALSVVEEKKMGIFLDGFFFCSIILISYVLIFMNLQVQNNA